MDEFAESDDYSFDNAAQTNEWTEHHAETKSVFEFGDLFSEFQPRPVSQMILELFLTDTLKSIFYIFVGFMHFCDFVQGSIEANWNLQRLLRYRSQFHFDPSVQAVLHESMLTNGNGHPRKFSKWFTLNAPIWINQISNIFILLGLRGFGTWRLCLLPLGGLLWLFLHIIWNYLYVLFGKPNFYHGYQLKQWFLMQSKFWLAGSLFFLTLDSGAVFWHHWNQGTLTHYRGPMHIVDYSTKLATVPLSEYFLNPYGRSANLSLTFLDDGLKAWKILKNHSNMGDLLVDEYQVHLDVAWGGKWGCPKQPEKHCRATVEFVNQNVYAALPLAKVLMGDQSLERITVANWDEASFVWRLIADHAPCHRIACGLRLSRTDDNLLRFTQDKNCTFTSAPNFPPVSADICEATQLDRTQELVDKCVATRLDKNFDNVTHRYKHSPLRRFAKPKPSRDDVLYMMGDCNTCTAQHAPRNLEKKRKENALMSFFCCCIGMVFLASWAVLAGLTWMWGWYQAPPENLHLELFPTGPPTFWQLISFYFAFF